MTIQIRKALEEDISILKSIADANRQELGFVFRPALARSVENHSVFVATCGLKLLGFVEYHHRRDSQTTLYHLVVDSTYRGIGVGKKLFFALAYESKKKNKLLIQLKCPIELDANEFYRSLDCKLAFTEKGKGRHLNVWQYTL